MFQQGPDRGPPTALRGWLSDVYFPALLDVEKPEPSREALASRLGAKATLDDPILGRAQGLPAIRALLDASSAWLRKHDAKYARVAFTTGVDRDVTEGTLSLTLPDKTLDLPVAVVAERRKSREVEVRVYFAAQSVGGGAEARSLEPASVNDPAPLAPAVQDFLAALGRGDRDAALAAFEEEGAARDARGLEHAKSGGALRAYFETLGPLAFARAGSADDGRTCALEIATAKPSLFVFERGDSGLVRALRIYGDL
jgi:hypothetical protein